jgi:cytoskeletal protein RodZ
MSFLVYFFVLLVAAGSVIFGLDMTQAPLNPPPYATLPATAQRSAPAQAAKAPAPAPARTVSAQPSPATTATVPSAPAAGSAATAMASATHEEAAPTGTTDAPAAAVAGRCNVEACAAAYHSFRAADCTYQPFGSERRACTKSGVTGKIASATRPRVVHHSDLRDTRRLTDRRGYDDDRSSGWSFDLFGGDR